MKDFYKILYLYIVLVYPIQNFAVMNPGSSKKNMTDPYWSDVLLLIQPEEGSSLILDFSNYARAVTTNGNAALSTAVTSPFGSNRKIISLDGTGDYLTLPDSDDWAFGTSDFTIEFWIYVNSYPTVGSGACGFFMQRADGSNYFYTGIYQGSSATSGYNMQLRVSGADQIFSQEAVGRTSPTATWVHVAATRSGSTHRVFWNGAIVGTDTSSAAIPNLASAAVMIGRFTGITGTNYDFNGYFGAVRITKNIARYTASFVPEKRPFPRR